MKGNYFFNRYALCLLILIGVSVFLVTAEPLYASADEAKDHISELGIKILNVASDESITLDERREELTDIIENAIDVDWMSRFVMGKYWRRASQEQKDIFQKYYREFLIQTYAPQFRGYQGEGFKVLNAIQRGEYEYIVQCEVKTSDGTAAAVDFRVRKISDKNKFIVLDFVAEGVSFINTQRSEINSAISQQGIDGFLDSLKAKVVELDKQSEV